jgi:type IV fimbrial biogenesis protein FimT
VLFRYDGTNRGRVEMREALRGTGNATCPTLPSSSCTLSSWTAGNTDNQLVTGFDPAATGLYEGVRIDVNGAPGGGNGGDQAWMDVCFTPLGRPFVRYAANAAFQPLRGVPVANVSRLDADSTTIGLIRTVMMLPNGAARVGTAVTP